MKTNTIFLLLLMVFAFAQVQAQDLPPKHRGMHPVLKADGTVVDGIGKTLGSIKSGKVCDVSGKVIGIISEHGDVTTTCGKSIGTIQKDGTFKSVKGHVVTTDQDGIVKVAGKRSRKLRLDIKISLMAAPFIVSLALKMKISKK